MEIENSTADTGTKEALVKDMRVIPLQSISIVYDIWLLKWWISDYRVKLGFIKGRNLLILLKRKGQ